LTAINVNGQEVVIGMPDIDLDFELLRCEQQIADLTLRIKQLKEASPSAGSGFLTSPFIELLQQNLESWQERKKTLSSKGAPYLAMIPDGRLSNRF
jgi:hypothetical protein